MGRSSGCQKPAGSFAGGRSWDGGGLTLVTLVIWRRLAVTAITLGAERAGLQQLTMSALFIFWFGLIAVSFQIWLSVQ
jgi:hypothetical protein